MFFNTTDFVYNLSFFTQSLLWTNTETLNYAGYISDSLFRLDPLAFLFDPKFNTTAVTLNTFSYFSFIDALFFYSVYPHFLSFNLVRTFFFNFYFTQILFQATNNLFIWTDLTETSLILFYTRPELALILTDWSKLLFNFEIYNYTLSSFYDMYLDYNFSSDEDYNEELFITYLYGILFLFLYPIYILPELKSMLKPFYIRFYYYYYSLSNEIRIQFDTFLLIFTFFFSYWVYLLMTWDEITAEVMIEIVHTFFFTFFLSAVVFLVLKYSIHFFTFLEASDTNGRSVLILIKQFFRDIMGLIGLFLRFLILIFRLNVYDNLDDILDSYYLFFLDFDDHNYTNELSWLILLPNFFEPDALSNFFWTMEYNYGIHDGLPTIFFSMWGKVFFFFFFILEEILRVLLALYISLLISFEVHAVSSSYIENKIKN